jgi:hypothetical protein
MQNQCLKQRDVVQYLQGRGAQINTKNRFLINERTKEHIEAIDDWTEENVETQYLIETAKTLVNKVESPDVGMMYSITRTRAANTGVYTVMHAMFMNIGVTAQDLI